MTDLFFYNYEFDAVEQFAKCISLNITKKYCGWGSVEIHFPITENRVINMLHKNTGLYLVTKNVNAVITGWKLGEDIAIFGKTLEWLMTKRTLPPISVSKKTPEEIAIYAVETAMGDFVNTGAPLCGGTAGDYSSENAKTVYDVVRDVLEPEKLGFSISADIDEKKLIFRAYKGKTIPVMLSVSNGTAYDSNYAVDMQEECSAVRFDRKMMDMGEWNAASNVPNLASGAASNAFTFYKITTAGSRFGLSCSVGEYLYSDARDGIWKTSKEKPRSAWDYVSKCEENGASKRETVLTAIKTLEEAKAELDSLKTLKKTETMTRHIFYGKDYELGDVLRVQTEFDGFKVTDRKRVTGVDIFFDVDTQGEKPTLDEED